MKRELAWRKSSRSSSDGDQCVELAKVEHGVAIRDSKDPQGPVLATSRDALRDAIRRVHVTS
ncbi:DUF397 domain-containing protein [Actinomadura latina]|uniref:DUF397 domain-containing protein n=1 Tax=Actinomadura latina TaxID=163603 RepID=A0A846YQX0_9ACTN|nr:DUF397 domain-containing protein [Actinomadura latina]NKZ02669.1 DUF397 domain-containing protein [Actinomadura latina]